MTREELREHCKKQIDMCEIWAIRKGEDPHGKIYEEHKLILELLEQEDILDKVRAEIDKIYEREDNSVDCLDALDELKCFIDKYMAKIEPQESEE